MWRDLFRRTVAPFPVAAAAGTPGSAWLLACAAADGGNNGDDPENAALRARIAALEAELNHAELLLRETNHRAKNALATIASLVAIELADIRDPQAREILQLTQERLSAVALVHQALQGKGGDAVLDLGALLHRLGSATAFSMGADERGIEVRVAAQTVPVEAGQAVSLALIANELLTNALKYAFAGRSGGCVELTLRRRTGKLLLRVKDNGIGAAPAPGRRTAGGTGLTLVRRLAEQIGARVRFGSRGGTSVTISIPCRPV